MSDFLKKLASAIESNTFVRLTLSKNRDKQSDLKKVLIKLAIIKKTEHLNFVYRHKTKDLTKNFLVEEGKELVEKMLDEQFMIANLFTTEENVAFEINKKGKSRTKTTKPTFTTPPDRGHDKAKNRLIGKADFLKELGILDASGRIQKDAGDKYKQIEKFVEIIDSLLKQNSQITDNQPIRITDMGSGKGYLTFAIYDFLVKKLNLKAKVTGIEIRPDMIELCNRIAQKVGFENLSFEEGFISDYDLPETDILIALHACDTATDDAISKGISAKAQLIICAPCCHKQIRRSIKKSELFDPVLNYGILKERQAEILTDTIRALLLEANGYKTKVFEFISTEHTGKNVLIVGQRHERAVDSKAIFEKIEKLKGEFGIEEHYLEGLLA